MTQAHYADLPDDLASCVRCRHLVIIRRSPRRHCFVNPTRTQLIRIVRQLGLTGQCGQHPAGEYHDTCEAFAQVAQVERMSAMVNSQGKGT